MSDGRPGIINTEELTPPSKIGVEPSEGRSNDAKAGIKTVKKCGVIDRVECSAKIQCYQHGR